MNEKNKDKDRFQPGFHVIAKPIGPLCNLNCAYCFYLEKQALFGSGEPYRMSDEVLSKFVANYIISQPTPVVEFVWQGGEPSLMGLDFFRRAVEYQRPYRKLKTINNSFQTNGTLLTDEWCEFFKEHNFFIGLSLDGPEAIHDRYRRQRSGQPTFKAVIKGLRLLQKHGIEYNILAGVAKETAYHPLEVYNFFKEQGIEFIQFTPIIERVPDKNAKQYGLQLALPAALDHKELNTQLTSWTVEPEPYGDFLIAVYEQWVRQDVGKIFVMNFEWALNAWIGNPSPVCIFAQQCGRAVAVEHNGDVYACDHYVYPEYRLGNILTDNLGRLIESSVAKGFGPHKETTLPRWCRECEVLKACWGGCPKHRFKKTPQQEPGLHYLCAGYQKFFLHIRKYLRVMTTLLENGQPASLVMEAIKGPLVIKQGTVSNDP
jgi:serine-type anaerobic sulfatase-maturating enzyme